MSSKRVGPWELYLGEMMEGRVVRTEVVLSFLIGDRLDWGRFG